MDKEQAINFATKFLEDILAFFGENLAVRASSDDNYIKLSVPSSDLNSILIGKHAEGLRDLQMIVRSALEVKGFQDLRVSIDVANYKKQRAEKIAKRVEEEWVPKLRATRTPMRLNLPASDRFTVHEVIEDYSDILAESEGVGRERILVLSLREEND
ncbi:MAG: single-stranded DNA-binding protein [Candidatus Nomurabacteria bacterium]|jgi:spoIIIJ-associated protein|nr:single-stranded DNA-binding protein [Candidatus Nomurabacteria bacterium]